MENESKEKELIEYLRKMGELEVQNKQMVMGVDCITDTDKEPSSAVEKVTDLKDLLKQSCLDSLRASKRIKNLQEQISILTEMITIAEMKLLDDAIDPNDMNPHRHIKTGDKVIPDVKWYTHEEKSKRRTSQPYLATSGMNRSKSLPRLHTTIQEYSGIAEENFSWEDKFIDPKVMTREEIKSSDFGLEKFIETKRVSHSTSIKPSRLLCSSHMKKMDLYSDKDNKSEKPAKGKNYSISHSDTFKNKMLTRCSSEQFINIIGNSGSCTYCGSQDRKINELTLTHQNIRQCRSTPNRRDISDSSRSEPGHNNMAIKAHYDRNEQRLINSIETSIKLVSQLKQQNKQSQMVGFLEHKKSGVTPIHQPLSGMKQEINKAGTLLRGMTEKYIRSQYLVIPGKSYSDAAKSPPIQKVIQFHNDRFSTSS